MREFLENCFVIILAILGGLGIFVAMLICQPFFWLAVIAVTFIIWIT